MEFLNLGWSEILLILTLAFIVLGPDRIKKFGGELGVFLRKLSKDGLFREVVQTTDELRNYPRKILNEAMLDQPVMYDQAEKSMIHPQDDVIDVEPGRDQDNNQTT
jgi:Sec-independent protein translocase protein TatA